MKQALQKTKNELWHYENDKRVEGKNKDMIGDCTGLTGNCSRLYGDCSNLNGNCTRLRGDCSRLRGNCTGLYGDCTQLTGDLDNCELTEEERKRCVDIQVLVKEE